MAGNTNTVHIFHLKGEASQNENRYLEEGKAQEEESKFLEFFRKVREVIVPQALYLEGSAMKIHLDTVDTNNLPFIIYTVPDSPLVNVVTYSGYCLKYSIDALIQQIDDIKTD